VVHEVFCTVFKKLTTVTKDGMPAFTKDGMPAAFRRWLYAITRLKLLEYWVYKGLEVDGIGGNGSSIAHVSGTRPPPDGSSEDGVPVRVLLLCRLLDLIRPEFNDHDWKAFWGVAAEGRSVKDVAKVLGMKDGAVRTAKCRVLKRLKEVAKAHGLFPAGENLAAGSAAVAQREVTS
jgi:DNA-directed RNA polymerase specialized sigma24 family protein